MVLGSGYSGQTRVHKEEMDSFTQKHAYLEHWCLKSPSSHWCLVGNYGNRIPILSLYIRLPYCLLSTSKPCMPGSLDLSGVRLSLAAQVHMASSIRTLVEVQSLGF